MSEPQEPQSHGLSEWIESQQTWLWRYLRFLGAPGDVAEDVCQETLLAALHHQIPDRALAVAMAWLRTTSRNFYRKQLRRTRQHEAMQQLLTRDALVTTEDLQRNASGDDYRDALRACLKNVPDDAKQLLDMRYRDNASRADMAKASGRSEEGIKTLLRRVKTQLRDCIEQRRTQ